MAKRKFEDILADLREADVDSELMEELEAYTGSNLRVRAERVPELENENASLKAQVARFEDEPKRKAAFEQYGITFADLRPAEREALMSAEAPEDGYTPEWVGQIAEKYDLAVTQGADSGAEGEPPAAAAVVGMATSPAQRGAKTTITPEDSREWSTETSVRFKKEHPDEFEALKRGESVVGVAAPTG